MQCPKCQFEQENTIFCKQCGLVFEKYYQYHAKESYEPKPVPSYITPVKHDSITQLPVIKFLNKTIIYVSLILLIVAFFKRNDFPVDLQYDPALLQAPSQIAIQSQTFDLNQNNIDYRIQPLYDYRLTGLVVSYRHHDSNYGLHQRWGDHLNIADICVVWGENASKLNLNAFTFWSGIFTCNFETKDSKAWSQFKPEQISNNHLLTENDDLRDIIADIQIGDQIQISGMLANYQNDQGFKRGTSTTRTDKGNGACETIYVEDFQIIRPTQNPWRRILEFSSISLLLSIGWWLISVIRE